MDETLLGRQVPDLLGCGGARLRLKHGNNHQNPLVVMLLLLSGQCPNPGPSYPCGVCNPNDNGVPLPIYAPPGKCGFTLDAVI